MTLIAIDFETADNNCNSACAIGMVKLENNLITDTYYSLIRPPRSRIYFTHIHGITWEMVKDSPTFLDIWDTFRAFTQSAHGFIAHNASFDRRVLIGTCALYSITPPTLPFYCTLKAARQTLELTSNTLNNVCNSLNIPLEHHHAASDALACAKVFLHCQNIQNNIERFCIK